MQGFGARAWRFSTVGVGNALVDVGTLNLLLWLFPVSGSLRIVAYNGAALLLANANSYLWNTLWTFSDKARGNWRQRVLFAGQALVNIGVNAGLFWLSISLVLGYADLSSTVAGNVAKVLSTVVAFTVSFFILRHLVFSGKRLSGESLSGKRPSPRHSQQEELNEEREAEREAP